jgi:hypothetical protein
MKPPKKPGALLGDVLQDFVRRGTAAQEAANRQLGFGAPFGWECPLCAVVNAEERERCVGCGTVKR